MHNTQRVKLVGSTEQELAPTAPRMRWGSVFCLSLELRLNFSPDLGWLLLPESCLETASRGKKDSSTFSRGGRNAVSSFLSWTRHVAECGTLSKAFSALKKKI